MPVLKRLIGLGRIFFSVFFDFKTTRQEKARIFFERAGGAFIKLGQFLVLQHGLVGPDYISEFLKLSSRVPETSFVETQKIFAEEKGTTIERFFSEFKPKPITSGSIAQIYEARLRNGGKVAVKIQRPEARKIFETDFSVIYFFAGLFDFFRLFSSVRAAEVIPEFISWTRRKLDFTWEARNADNLYEHSKSHALTVIPAQYLEFTTPKILIQDFVEDGINVGAILLGKEKKDDFQEMADYLIKDSMRQYFIDGFFYADPHPANLFFLPAGKLAYLDFGIVGEAAGSRLLFLKFFYGLARRDVDFLSRNFFDFCQKNEERELEDFLQADPRNRWTAEKILEKIREIVFEKFKKEIERITEPVFNTSFFFKLIELSGNYGFSVPKQAFLFLRTLSVLEMICLRTSSAFDMIKALNGFFDDYPLERAEELIKEGIHEKEAGKKIISLTGVDWEFFREISLLEKERALAARERMMEIFLYYAEKHEELKPLLKSIKN